MGEFTIRVKPDVIQDRVNKAEIRTIDSLSQQFGLDKGEILGDGIDLKEATHLDLDTFMKLSGNDDKITKGDLLKFAGTETADDVVRQYARGIAESLPQRVMDSASADAGPASTLAFQVVKRGYDIIVKAQRVGANGAEATATTEPSASGVFSIINGRDSNKDNKIAIAGELRMSTFVATVADALRIAEGGAQITPTQALKVILEKAGRVNNADLDVQYGTNQ